MDDVVVFDSWGGRYADNPRALSEAMHAAGWPLRQVWVLADGVAGPPWAEHVAAGTDAHVAALERARLIVANNLLPPFAKRRDAFYLQTWHGTPFKRIGFDLPDPDPGYLDHLAAERAQWDLLLSPSAVSTPRLRSAFGYAGEVLESGYPRNDALVSGDRRPAGRTRVLYAPTFREPGAFEQELDPAAFGPEVELVVRAHHFASDDGQDDIRDDLLAADVLVTDYSSVLFDFAITGRPIVLFAYDLERYRTELNGFYFDLEPIAPGPVVATSAAVAHAVAAPARGYPAFRETFCALGDGHATGRVLAALSRVGLDR